MTTVECLDKMREKIDETKDFLDVIEKYYEVAIRKQILTSSEIYRPEDQIGAFGGDIIYIDTIEEFKVLVKKIHKAFKQAKRTAVNIWNPYGDKAIIAWEYRIFKKHNIRIKIWKETTVDEFPNTFPGGTCRFEKQQTEEYKLVCKKWEDT